jgi:predicted MFS family arabinose efflux permease
MAALRPPRWLPRPGLSVRPERVLLAADGFAMFGSWIDFLAIMTLAAYRFQVSPYQMAWFSAAAILPGILVSPWVGKWCDRGHARRALLASIVIRIATTVAVMACHDLWLLTLLVAARSVLAAFVAPAVNVIAVRTVDAERRPRFYSILNVLGSSAKVLAPTLGTIASSFAGESFALGLSIVLALVSLLLFAAVQVPMSVPARAPPAGDGAAQATAARLGLRGGFGLLLATAGCYAFFVFMVNNLVPLVLQRSGFDKALLGILIGCSGAGNLVSGLWLARQPAHRQLQGRLADLLWPAAAAASGFFAIGCVLLRPQGMASALAGIFFVGGLFSARFAVATNVYLTRRHADAIGHASAWMQGCQNTMILVAPMLGAVVFERFGPAAVFLAASGVAAMALATIALSAWRVASPSSRSAGSVRTHGG